MSLVVTQTHRAAMVEVCSEDHPGPQVYESSGKITSAAVASNVPPRASWEDHCPFAPDNPCAWSHVAMLGCTC